MCDCALQIIDDGQDIAQQRFTRKTQGLVFLPLHPTFEIFQFGPFSEQQVVVLLGERFLRYELCPYKSQFIRRILIGMFIVFRVLNTP